MPLCLGSCEAHSCRSGSRQSLPCRDTKELRQRFSNLRLTTSLIGNADPDVTPPILPMSKRDDIVVDRLSRKVDASSFATVLKAYLIIKTRLAAQRANREFQLNRRRSLAILNRRSSRVALESPSHKARRSGLKKSAPPPEAPGLGGESRRAGNGSSAKREVLVPQASPPSRRSPADDDEDSSHSSGARSDSESEGVKPVGAVGRMKACQSLLDQRLGFLGFKSVRSEGDGNCQFRSCSWNMFGSEEYHRVVRARAVRHMREHRDEYGVFFGKEEFERYLKNMSRPGTWGDELTVRAIADSFQCTIHIITSTDANWYLRYDPQDGEETLEPVRHIFLTYISPIHYNSFTIEDTSASDTESTGAKRA
ncbi:OTU family cysteine protease [Besnoitia besnoiti]|uniref:OTU family cysteine protease n=1 Tax=Besnoitia besnoiti TaxID=94643 RepID=A0A2A9MN35_BESBE|nr:OTU family cysteine protease [Besnoitia besnoiti]PFH37901.1 OTU family cysteine protease [Besnoitia besnoiti]